MEGKEVRFGISRVGAVGDRRRPPRRTARSTRCTTASRRSAGSSPMVLMQLGEVVFGGVGSGLYGLLVFAIVAVFIAGLMVGRTPEYLGKKIEAFEMKMASLAILVPAAAVLLGTALACIVERDLHEGARATTGRTASPRSSTRSRRRATTTARRSRGLTASGTFYATAGGICMLVGRYWIIIPVLAIAGSLARKKIVPPSSGTLPTDGPLFVLLLVGTVVLVGALTFVPALALGPIVEHLAGVAHERRRSSATRSRRRSSAVRRADRPARDPRRVRQARSAPDDPQPGDVRRRGRQRVHDAAVRARARHRRRRRVAGFIARDLACGCGSRCCSRTSPRRWPRAAARRRPTACARRARDVHRASCSPSRGATRARRAMPSSQLRAGDIVLVEAGEVIPGDGEIIEGVASVDESAITGESAPVIRESGGDRSAVTGGTRVLSDWLIVRITTAARRDVPRSHDRDGRGREAQEDAERDRARHPARRPDDHLPARDRDAATRSRVFAVAARPAARARRSR